MDAENNIVAGTGPTPQSSASMPSPLRIFISYRLDPDAILAEALQVLLETSISPKPNVFVSGAGGLKPSRVTFKQQLQTAASHSDAFVALITKESKAREWILFEAGAAWGRDLMYAPVLVGIDANELPDTIGDYFSSNARSLSEMQRLVASLADLNSGTIRQRFSNRFDTFHEAVQGYLTGNKPANAPPSTLSDAVRLAVEGATDEAAALFATLEKNATDRETQCLVRIEKCRFLNKDTDFLTSLFELEPFFSDTAILNYQLGNECKRPNRKLSFYSRAAGCGDYYSTLAARFEMGRIKCEIGTIDDGIADLFRVISHRGSMRLSALSAQLVSRFALGLTEHEKLMVLLSGTDGEELPGISSICELAEANSWNTLNLYCRTRIESNGRDGQSVNNRGRALQDLGFYCAAYAAYSDAASLGASAGICNMANLLLLKENATASVKLLRSHEGPYNVSRTEFPHQLFAQAEEAIREEDEKVLQKQKLGEVQFMTLWSIADKAITAMEEDVTPFSGRIEFGDTVFDVCDSEITRPVDVGSVMKSDCKIHVSALFKRRLVVISFGKAVGFVVLSSLGIDGVWFDDFVECQGLKRARWLPNPAADAVDDYSENREIHGNGRVVGT